MRPFTTRRIACHPRGLLSGGGLTVTTLGFGGAPIGGLLRAAESAAAALRRGLGEAAGELTRRLRALRQPAHFRRPFMQPAAAVDAGADARR